MQGFVTRVHSQIRFGVAAALIGSMLAACGGGGGSGPSTSQLPPVSAPVQNTAPPMGSTMDANATVLTSAMISQSSAASNFRYHIFPVQIAGNGRTTQGVIFPDDVTFNGGAVVTSARQHDIFLNCKSSCFGLPQVFQADLNASTFVHVIDQYVHVTTNNRYPFGRAFAVTESFISNPITSFGTNPVVSENDIFNIVHAAAKVAGVGYGNEYHVFLAPGLDHCFDQSNVCYSPDNNSAFVFCAYHASITFKDIGHVIYSVEPFQNVPGCGNNTGSAHVTGPNPIPTDDTATVLSHEFFESVTDPDPNTGWSNGTSGEIGDPCDPNLILRREIQNLDGHKFLIQPEYSNANHGCFF
ncbi:MAG: hypothetical protein ACXWNJ_05920 [Vulcanimicrobiaceae bacterium]